MTSGVLCRRNGESVRAAEEDVFAPEGSVGLL